MELREELEKYLAIFKEAVTPLGFPPKKPVAQNGAFETDDKFYDAYQMDKYIAYLEKQIFDLKQQNSDAGWQAEYNRQMDPDQFRNNW
jgi:hypothetical protein